MSNRFRPIALTGAGADYDPLLQLIGDAPLALLGEATHGTHEFYRERAEITRRLIVERGFNAVAVEADWPDAYRVNRYVRAESDDRSARKALADFRRFPAWMWRNDVVVEFVEWLRAHNDALPGEAAKVGFYGLDLYSLASSIQAVLAYLDREDPQAAARARQRYACFDHASGSAQAYGYAASFGLSSSCEEAVVAQLCEMVARERVYAGRDGRPARDEFFQAAQNARLVKNAEQYYRTMFSSQASSWNVRDRHMAQTLDGLRAHLSAPRREARIAVWAHNSHLGDARATGMGRSGEINVGQLVRERHAGRAVLIGFTTYAGTVTAASEWDGPPRRMRIRAALPGSYETLLHQTGLPRLLVLPGAQGSGALAAPRLERAIGVIYLPETERQSHYFEAYLAAQFDAVLHFDETQALEPLERRAAVHAADAPETYPVGE